MEKVRPTLFEGEAGSGKTTSLAIMLTSQLQSMSLAEGQKVLALTFMHGSRRRLHSRLTLIPGLRQRFTCCTVDSLAWQISRRWRSLARAVFGNVLGEADGFDATCEVAAALLNRDEVSQWVARTYPVVIIDELQDVRGNRLSVVRELTRVATVIAAADEFQDLNGGDGENEAVAWMHNNAIVHHLNVNHRTKSRALLSAGSAIRSGVDVPTGGDFRVKPMPSHHLAATYAALKLATSGTRDVVFLVPTGPNAADFVRDTIDRLTVNPIHLNALNRDVGPFSIMWEPGMGEEEARIASAIELPDDEDAVFRMCDLRFDSRLVGVSDVSEALRRRRSLTGQTIYSVPDVRLQIKKVVQQSRSFRTRDDTRLRAMTVHQAKNREFRGVIVLWPYEVGGSAGKQRRLLYNATTRAREWVLVLVQDPSRKRVSAPPFMSVARPARAAASTARSSRRRR